LGPRRRNDFCSAIRVTASAVYLSGDSTHWHWQQPSKLQAASTELPSDGPPAEAPGLGMAAAVAARAPAA